MDWFDNVVFWELFYDWMFSPQVFEEAKEQVDDIVKLTGINSGKVLDLCCGPGRHSIPFNKKGFEVTGVDLHQFLLDKAKSYSIKENLEIELVQADMRKFVRTDSYDLVINMYSSFGYFQNPDEDFHVLDNVYHSLKKDGKIIIDVRGKEIHAMQNIEIQSHDLPNGDLIIDRGKVRDGWTSVDSDWMYIKDGVLRSFQLNFNLYSGAELRRLMSKAGFQNVRLYGDLKGIPYNQKAKRLIAVGEK
ncbi:MAG: class I SAM-dependent methyltransferase [Thermodesulfobacteriota bacterium]